MSATAEPTQRLTYPISPDYVSGWTSERAISELVANARDDDPGFTFEYADGVLTIEDQGPGVPEEGLVLGWSSKRGANSDQFVGIHGEGLKISSLVLARDPAIGKVVVETVGYGFVPTVTTNGRLVPVGGRRATTGGTQLLAYDFFESDRKVGTKVTVECTAKLADKVRSRFRFLNDPNYQTPTEHGRVLDEAGGRVYIGGVFVSAHTKLLFSYDFPLAQAKQYQNRDRTVIDGYALDRLVSDALAHLEDEALIERWVQTALNGKLHRGEQYFSSVNPGQRRAMRAISKRIFEGRKVMFSNGYTDEEAVLDLRDRGYEVIKAKALDGYQQNGLFAALGIKAATTLRRKPQKQEKQRTTWIKHSDLNDSEREILDTAVRIVRGAYGVDAVGDCDAYGETYLEGADEDLRWGGFYEVNRRGRIGLQRQNLQSLEATLDVLVHEAAHRLRHRRGRYDYADRTRGFESQLGKMAATALQLAHAANAIPDAEELIAKKERETAVQAQADAKAPVSQLRALITERMAATGLTQAELADECGVSTGTLRQLSVGRQRRHWSGGSRSDGAPRLLLTQAVCQYLGLEWAPAHLILLSENVWCPSYTTDEGSVHGGGYTRRVSKRGSDRSLRDGRIIGTRGDEMQKCIAGLTDLGVEAEVVAAFQKQLDHAVDGANGAYLEPYRTLLEGAVRKQAVEDSVLAA